MAVLRLPRTGCGANTARTWALLGASVAHSPKGRIWPDKRAFRPVWLLEGLDELDEKLREANFFEWLVVLPGAKLVTCRAAVFEALAPQG